MSTAHDRLRAYAYGRPSLPHDDHRLPDKLDLKKIPAADLRNLGSGIVIHGGLVYRYGDRLKIDVDLETLRAMTGVDDFYADAHHVWHFSTRIDKADPAHFRVEGFYWMDLERVWYESEVVVGADPLSFRRLGADGAFWCARRYLYASGNCIDDVPIADIDQFQPYGDSAYARYKDRIYYGYKWMPEANAASFEVNAKYSHRAQDSQRSYLFAHSA